MFKAGAHVSMAGGVWNAPKNAEVLGCETFQIFSRSPQGGEASVIDDLVAKRFKIEMQKYNFKEFVIHCPYFINFGSSNNRVFYGSISVIQKELERGSLLGAKYVMTHLGSFKDLGEKKGIKQVKEGLKKVLQGYGGSSRFLLEIAAGSGEIIGDTFEELAEIMEPLKKMKGFGGICFDTQHAFASGYDLRDAKSVALTFAEFDKAIGLQWLKMSHINDSEVNLASRKDRHEHIGQGEIGEQGFLEIMKYLKAKIKGNFLLILETEHDKVKQDIKILKALRNKVSK